MPAKDKYTYKEKKYEFENDPFSLEELFNAMREGSEENKKHPEKYNDSITAKSDPRGKGDKTLFYADPAREKVLDWLRKLWEGIDKIIFQMQQQPKQNRKMSVGAERKGVGAGDSNAWSTAIWEALLAQCCQEEKLQPDQLKTVIKLQWLPYLAQAEYDYNCGLSKDEKEDHLRTLFRNMRLTLDDYIAKMEVEEKQDATSTVDKRGFIINKAKRQKDEEQDKRLQADAELLVRSAYQAYPAYVKEAVPELITLCEQYATKPSDAKDADEIKLMQEPDEGVKQINELLGMLKDKEKSDFKKFKEFNQHFQQSKDKILSSPIVGVKSFVEKTAKILAVFFAAVAGLAGAGIGAYFAGRAAYNRLFPQDYFLGKVHKVHDKQVDSASSQEIQSEPLKKSK